MKNCYGFQDELGLERCGTDPERGSILIVVLWTLVFLGALVVAVGSYVTSALSVAEWIKAETAAKVIFSKALRPREGELYWITIVEADAPESTKGAYQYLQANAKEATLRPVAQGRYEVRLHARYPSEAHKLIHQQSLQVE